MNLALHMLTRSAEWRAARPKHGDEWALVLTNQDPVPLICETGLPVYFTGSLTFEFERDTRDGHEGGWKAAVRKYVYSLRIGPDQAGEFLAWHWHPEVGDPRDPHVHVRGDNPDVPGLSDMHLPTSRVFFEDVLLFVVRDLKGRCRDEDAVALTAMRDTTRRWASWK